LFADNSRSELWKITGNPIVADFKRFGIAINIPALRVENLLSPLLHRQEKVAALVANSYLRPPVKKAYLDYYYRKLNLLRR
jgi:hypothetical protein